MHFGVDGVERFHVEQAAADARLVGGDDDAVARLGEPGDGFRTAGNGAPFGGRLDKALGVMVDDAVAVKNDELHGKICGN